MSNYEENYVTSVLSKYNMLLRKREIKFFWCSMQIASFSYFNMIYKKFSHISI